MLRTLYIKNIVLIKELTLNFQGNLSIFTGETGAGKSILLDALSLALGTRADTSLVSKNASQGTVIITFDSVKNPYLLTLLESAGIVLEESGLLLLKRTLTPAGKTQAFINDQPVTLVLLKTIASYLIEIHGQFDRLLDQKNHKDSLDAYAGITNEVESLKIHFKKWKDLENQYEALQLTNNEDRLILLNHYLKEFEEIDLNFCDEEQVLEERSRLSNGEKIITSTQSALYALGEGTNSTESTLSKAIDACGTASLYDQRFSSFVEHLNSALIQVQETFRDLYQISQEDLSDLEALEKVEQRLMTLKDLSRKHRCTINELPQKHMQLLEEFQSIDKKEEALKQLSKRMLDAKKTYEILAKKLSKQRLTSARELEKEVIKELSPLKMSHALFKIDHKYLEEKDWSSHGLDDIVFKISTNSGKFGMLNQIASGGERSRFMLALRVALLSKNTKSSIIFDEIDSGVGGAVSTAIGQRLKTLGSSIQVLSITHSPQVVAWAQNHYKVVKKDDDSGSTYTNVQHLNSKESEEEIARMLSGASITDQARAAAKTLKTTRDQA